MRPGSIRSLIYATTSSESLGVGILRAVICPKLRTFLHRIIYTAPKWKPQLENKLPLAQKSYSAEVMYGISGACLRSLALGPTSRTRGGNMN